MTPNRSARRGLSAGAKVGLALGGLAFVGAAIAVAAASSGSTSPTSAPGPSPEPGPQPKPKPPPQPEPGLPLVPGVQLVDLRSKAPAEYIRQQRAPSDIRAIVLHQTGFSWKPDNPNWAKVRAHFVVRQDGTIVVNFLPTTQMRYGSSLANPFAITIEHEGNFPSDAGQWWEGDTYGRDDLADYPAMVHSSRQLIAALREQYPTITHVYAHRQWQGDEGKPNCPGPDIWRAIGRWSMAQLGLKDGGPGWHYEGGLAIPESWTTPWPENLA